MTDLELAEEIERQTKDSDTVDIQLPPNQWQQIIAALRRGAERDLPEYHGKECYYCHEIISAFDSTRGPGGCALCHADEPGVVKWHHSSCVSQRLRPPSGEIVMVPRELTPAMHEAGLRFAGTLHANYEDCWKVLIAAAEASKEAK